MAPEDALQAAITAGWDFKRAEIRGAVTVEAAFVDPLFWESLGKTLGWEELNSITLKQDGRAAWHQMWINFIDHLAQGKKPEEFFLNLT